MNHGKPKHSRISNVFEPIELLMPIAPWPCLVTMTLDTASGTLVPAAKNVRPMIESGMSAVSPVEIETKLEKEGEIREKKTSLQTMLWNISFSEKKIKWQFFPRID